jgi:hypothetical protein
MVPSPGLGCLGVGPGIFLPIDEQPGEVVVGPLTAGISPASKIPTLQDLSIQFPGVMRPLRTDAPAEPQISA